ncbi:MAG: glycerate kinase [Clostridiaceae bacterium]|jgi:glycerate kinase|nr:glycerate kinase [Clostridiaceae bacterium]
MKIVISPDSFKGSLTAKEAADSIEEGIKRVLSHAEIIKVPMADGGEGTVQSLVDCTKGELISVKVRDPLLRQIDSYYGILGDKKTAVIEMAAASGLPLLKDAERNPMKTTTYGTGQLIKDAVHRGCSEIIVGLGGSATNDGGMGMLQALGAKFTDENGREVNSGGENLNKIKHIDLSEMDSRLKQCKFTAACDVDNPLYGKTGAAYVFGPQKGASEKEVQILDSNLKYYASIIKKELGISVDTIKGAGAAGGLGAAVMAFLNAENKKGIDIVIDVTSLESKLQLH